MKKSLLALAVLGAFAGVAQAQTSVTIYGSFDAGIRGSENAAGDRNYTMSSTGTYNSNRLGFRGVEDLGGGMNAHFTLETGFDSGNGNLNAGQTTTLTTTAAGVTTAATSNVPLFNRSAFVGLGGAWGSVDLGRQYSVNFKAIGAYDPFVYKFTGVIPTATIGGLTRLNNDIQYTGAFGPVTVRAEYALGQVAGDTGAGATAALGASFKTGPFSFGGAYTTRANTTDTADQNVWTIGGAFATGPFRVAAGYANDDRDAGFAVAGGAADEIENAWLGGSYNMSPAFALTAGWYRTEQNVGAIESDLAIVGATYALSKRTNFYADIDHRNTEATVGGVTGELRQTGFSVGINHLF
jgi:predicted porin